MNFYKKQLYPIPYTLYPNKGFTLIELLVVIVIMVVVGTIVGSILFSSLRDSNKTSNINEVRTNGTFALSQMTKIIQGAKLVQLGICDNVSCPNPTPIICPKDVAYACVNNALLITNLDNTVSTISAYNKSIYFAQNPTTSIMLNNLNTEVHDNIPPPDSTDPCDNTSLAPMIFSYRQKASGPPTITINFFMSFKTSSAFAEQKVCIPFQTSVSPRNFVQ